jgi:hypothetical protein
VTEAEKVALIAAWIAGQDAGLGSKGEKKHWWAIEAMMEIPFEDPELAWELIERIHAAAVTEEVKGSLAAGPLESLMGEHGARFIDRVEVKARREPKFRELLRPVWLSESGKTQWERFYKAAGIKPFPYRSTKRG